MPNRSRSLTDLNIKKKEIKIVDCLIPFSCDDKKDNERWTKGRSYINKIRPFRCVIIGPPNSGKSSICKNLIVHAEPEYTKVYVISNGSSKEWSDYADVMFSVDDLTKDVIGEFTNEIDGQRIVIIDDIEMNHVSKEKKEFFNLLFKHISSHYNLSIIVSIQEYKMLPIELRANINVFCLSLNIKDIEGISILGKKVGLSYKQFKTLFTNMKHMVENTQYEYLVIDNTINTPVPISLNFYEKIDLDDLI